MVNHVIASHYPPELLHPGTLFGRDKYASELHTRQNQGGNQGNNQVKFWDYREACNNCVENCPAGKIINPNDCSKCKDCPNGQKPDGEQKKCVEDKKSKKFNEVYKDKRQTYKENRGFERWKKSHQRTYDRARNREDRTKVRRMARCLALVPLAMGVAAVEEYSETFDEDWTDSMELLEFWPEGLEVDEWVDDSSDELFENDDYIDKYVNIGEGNQRREIALVPAVRDRDNIPSKFSRNAIRTSPRTDLVLRGDLTKRCPICPLIVIFLSALSTVARVVKIARTAIQIAKGFNNVARRTKRASTRKISESKNWRNCLAGRDPQK
ncbi:uncharacterized protein VDAG_02990 [Verticillium dahliae VdLs.17]|uniref:Uncharacterized protein n=2 Tax=Verticillium dahliae TaxID=27337 RepID=G2WXL1_VERDV|nr:uncharacterized protein VDAG_02990 [Verticillium dahliae VdLs.17]EGY21466.1 hypothetical protein VDAG_02990 [Verticillium dahliae VdLs.17]KAH6707468.1 hypothetical protein EV126DRAFT_457699 [Verticillium dahliae]